MSLAQLQRASSPVVRPASALTDAIRKAHTGALLWLRIQSHDQLQATLGDVATERLMQAIADALQGGCRTDDPILRHGEACFVAVAPRVRTLRAAQGIAARLLRTIDGPVLEANHLHVRACLGVCFFPSDADTVEEVVRKASLAALHAETTQHQVCFYEPGLDTAAAEVQELSSELVLALRAGRFEVAYQAQFDLQAHALHGAEALARFTSPTRGPVSPGRFVPLLEQLGLASQLTDVILGHVAAQIALWHGMAPDGFRVSVNLSGSELRSGRAQELLGILSAAGAPPERVTFEITESVWLRTPDEAMEVIEALTAAGAHLALDDFGSGYSSLGYLARLPVHTVKIDRCFVRDLTQENTQTLLRGVIGMVHALGLHVVVEGVESPEQLSIVRELQADTVQGFLTARPGPASDVTRRLRLEQPTAAKARPAPSGAPHVDKTQDMRPLPMLPAVLQALCALQGSGGDADELVELASCDPCLAMYVVQLSRAGARAPDELSSMSRAVVRVGARQVLDRALAGTTCQVFLPSEGTSRLWTHAIEVACWSAAVAATATPHLSADRCYLAGLLHDVGRFAMLDRQPTESLQVEASGWTTPTELLQAERRTLEADHTTIGAAEAHARHLPDDVCAVIEHHHEPMRTLPPGARGLVAVVQAADVLALLQNRHPELRRAGPIARAAKIKKALAPLQLPLSVDHDALSALWADVADDAARRQARVGL